MKLSSRARYAVRMMIAIARESSEAHVSLGQIAKQTKISRRYLDQLAHGLKRVALIRGISGRRGGYQLTRPAEEITLAEIIESAIGPINIVDCVLEPDVCLQSDVCKCRWVYSSINGRIEEVKPWELAKQGKDEALRAFLDEAVGRLRIIAHWLEPFLPETAEKLRCTLDGRPIQRGDPLFPRLQ